MSILPDPIPIQSVFKGAIAVFRNGNTSIILEVGKFTTRTSTVYVDNSGKYLREGPPHDLDVVDIIKYSPPRTSSSKLIITEDNLGDKIELANGLILKIDVVNPISNFPVISYKDRLGLGMSWDLNGNFDKEGKSPYDIVNIIKEENDAAK